MSRGKLTVVTGPMASGKTGYMFLLLGEYQVLFERIVLFKSDVDTRDGSTKSASRSGLEWDAVSVPSIGEMLRVVDELDPDVVGIEEAQFFRGGPSLNNAVQFMLRRGIHVVVSCLNLDSKGKPFEGIPEVLALADDIVKRAAVCTACGALATRTQRFVNGVVESADAPIILVDGAQDDVVYAPRCIECWVEPGGHNDYDG